MGVRDRREEMNSESKVPALYPVETNSRGGKPELVLETVMTIGTGFFQIFLKQAKFLQMILLVLLFAPAIRLKPSQCLISYLLQESLALLLSLSG